MRARHQVEMLDKLFQQLVGFFSREVEETDGEILEVTPALDVFVVEVVVNPVVGFVRRSPDCRHNP